MDIHSQITMTPHAHGLSSAPMPVSVAAEDDGHHAPPRPFERLGQLLDPERREISAVIVFAVAVAILSLAIPITVESLVNTVAFGVLMWPLLAVAGILFCALGLAAALRGLQVFLVESIQQRLFVRVVADYAHRFPKVRIGSPESGRGAELANRFFDVLNVQKSLATLLLDGVALVVTVVVGMIVLASYHPFLLGFAVVLLGLIAILLFVLGRGGVRTSLEESRAKYEVAAWLEELLRCPGAFKSAAGKRHALEHADRLASDYIQARGCHFRIVWRQTLFALGLQVVASTTLLGLGGWLVIDRQLTLGQLVASELIVTLVVASVAKISKYADAYYDLLSGAEKLGLLTDLPLDREGGDALPSLTASKESRGAAIRIVTRTQEEVCSIAPGERTVLLGEAGDVFEILAGRREPHRLLMQIDGEDSRGVAVDALRERVAFVRGSELILGSILENVLVGRDHIPVAEVRDALRAVGLLDRLLDLPRGLDTPISPGGSPLTHQEAVQLTFARAIVGRPRLILVDGALDVLDPRSGFALISRLFDRAAPWTLLVASNVPEIADRCDRVIHVNRTALSAKD